MFEGGAVYFELCTHTAIYKLTNQKIKIIPQDNCYLVTVGLYKESFF